MMNADVCPCCGSEDICAGPVGHLVLGVRCQECGLQVAREIPWDNPQELSHVELAARTLRAAIRAWNRRAIERGGCPHCHRKRGGR